MTVSTRLTDFSSSASAAPHATITADAPGKPGSSEMPTVLDALRAATGDRHALLHTLMPLSVDSAALDDYLGHLAILRAWLAPIDTWLNSFDDGPQSSLHGAAQTAANGSWALRENRLTLIDADLAHECTHESSYQTPHLDSRDASLASLASRGDRSAAYRWGVCYVIEGSQLGGAVLYARLKERLAPHPLGYLKAGRESLGPRWQAFIGAMTDEVRTPDEIRAACDGAVDAFDRLIDIVPRRSHQHTPPAHSNPTDHARRVGAV